MQFGGSFWGYHEYIHIYTYIPYICIYNICICNMYMYIYNIYIFISVYIYIYVCVYIYMEIYIYMYMVYKLGYSILTPIDAKRGPWTVEFVEPP